MTAQFHTEREIHPLCLQVATRIAHCESAIDQVVPRSPEGVPSG